MSSDGLQQIERFLSHCFGNESPGLAMDDPTWLSAADCHEQDPGSGLANGRFSHASAFVRSLPATVDGGSSLLRLFPQADAFEMAGSKSLA